MPAGEQTVRAGSENVIEAQSGSSAGSLPFSTPIWPARS